VRLCRPYHNSVHGCHSNAVLAAAYNSVELLLAADDEATLPLRRWAAYASRQPTRHRRL